MAVKPTLYYCLVRGGYGQGFKVLAVTSEKGRQVYGRDEDDASTHVASRDVIHRFPEGTTLDFARAASDRAMAEADHHKLGIRMASEELSRLQDVKDAAVLAAAKGFTTGKMHGEPERASRSVGPQPTRSDEGPAPVALRGLKPNACGYPSGCLCIGKSLNAIAECAFWASSL